MAAGARPAIPPIPGPAESGFLTNESVIFDLIEQSEHLIILGGGYIGCEFAHFFSALGTRVTVIDHSACLLTTGRRPNTDRLALETTGVELDDRGFVVVDDGLRTTHPDIYAYVDVIGQGMFKHTSCYEGELAYRNAHGASLAVDYTANPHAVFSHSQIGSVGLTERTCRDQGLD